jgi:hypothetical protein
MGGGRWARVYVDVLLELLPPSTTIVIYSPRNCRTMADWIRGRGVGERVIAVSSLPVFPERELKAVIVVNAANDHEKSIEWALSQDAAVLVEKPLTLSFSASRRLVDEAERHGAYLAAAHVFLFAEYLVNFKKMIQALDGIISIDVLWADAAVELRHGEAKSFDPGLRIFEDCIPHVMSMLDVLNPGESLRLVRLEFLRGGAQLELVLASTHLRYAVRLVRNGVERRRVLTAADSGKFFTLDFSQEPGRIVNGSETISASPDWATAQKPLSRMLEAFLGAAAGGHRDARLGSALGLRAATLSEEILPAYQAAQAEWLSKRLPDADENDEDLRYALREIGMSGYPHSRRINEESLSQIIQNIKYKTQVAVSREQLVARPIDFVKSVLKKFRTK